MFSLPNIYSTYSCRRPPVPLAFDLALWPLPQGLGSADLRVLRAVSRSLRKSTGTKGLSARDRRSGSSTVALAEVYSSQMLTLAFGPRANQYPLVGRHALPEH